MNADPTVTVVVPTYNCEGYLSEAIESVLGQSFEEWELVVIDDGSTDDTQAVLARYRSHPRIRCHRLDENQGPSAARNHGIRLARGQLLSFLDADDFWAPGKLEAEVSAMADPAIDVCCVAAWRLYSRGRELRTKRPPLGGEELYKELLFRNSLPGSSSGIMVRRRCFEEVGLFDTEMRTGEDRDMWVRLAAAHRFAFVPVPLVYINRRRKDSAIRDRIRMARGREAFLRNRESDIPERFRHLLPELRQRTYYNIAKKYFHHGNYSKCRRYCTRTIAARPEFDSKCWSAARLFTRSLLPARLQFLHDS